MRKIRIRYEGNFEFKVIEDKGGPFSGERVNPEFIHWITSKPHKYSVIDETPDEILSSPPKPTPEGCKYPLRYIGNYEFEVVNTGKRLTLMDVTFKKIAWKKGIVVDVTGIACKQK